MGRPELFDGVLFVLLAAGAAAMTQVGAAVFPHHENLIFWAGLIAVILAVIGLVVRFAFPSRRAPPTGPRSTSFIGKDADFKVGKLDSSADTLADVEGGKIELGEAVHKPASGAAWRPPSQRGETPEPDLE